MNTEDKQAIAFLQEAAHDIELAIKLIEAGEMRFICDPTIEGVGYGMLVGNFEISKRRPMLDPTPKIPDTSGD